MPPGAPGYDGRVDVVTTHLNADLDGLAAMVALWRLRDRRPVLVVPGSMDATARRFLADHEAALPPVRGVRELLREVRAGASLGELLLADVARLSRTGRVGELAERFERVLAFDTHPPEEGDAPRAPLPPAGSCAAALALALRDAGRAPEPVEATLFLAAIHVDTGHFTFPSTTAVDHEAAALCLGWGARPEAAARYAPRGFSRHQLRLLEAMSEDVAFVEEEGAAAALLTLETPRWEPDLSVLLAQLREAEGWPAAFLVAATGGRLAIIGRSDGSLDVGAVLRGFGGGGHRDAGSAVLRGLGLREARGLVAEAVRDALVRRRAGDVAVRPFVSVPASATVRETADLLHAHRLNAVPIERVEGDCRRIPGQVTRQEVDAALRHGLGDRPVLEISASAPPWIDPRASLAEARARLLASPGRVLVVGEPPCRPEGVLTRTAVLRMAVEGVRGGRRRLPGPPEVRARLRRGLGASTPTVLRLGELAAELGMDLHLVGGCVRDLFLERPLRDLDLVTSGDALRLVEEAAARMGGRWRAHAPFGTATWLPPEGPPVDVVTARSELYARPGALPEVRPSGLRQDLYRRDFTINAMAVAVTPAELGEVVDPFAGLDDLRRRRLRVLHGLSFHDDPTRAWRAARFAARFDFRLAPDTAALMRSAARAGVFAGVSRERLGQEFERLFAERHVAEAWRCLRRWGLLAEVHPELRVDAAFLERLAAALEARQRLAGLRGEAGAPPRTDLLWLHLAAHLPAEARRELERLVPGGRRRRERWLRGPERVRRALRALGAARRPSEAGRALEELDPVERAIALAFADNPAAARWIAWWEEEGRAIRAAVDGRALLAAGVPPGPAVGAGLRAALDAARDGLDAGTQRARALAAASVTGGGAGETDGSPDGGGP